MCGCGVVDQGSMDDDTDGANLALLSFYKNIVTSLNQVLLPLQAQVKRNKEQQHNKDSPGADKKDSTGALEVDGKADMMKKLTLLWFTVKRLLHLFNVNFNPQDCDALLGSGVFAALFRFITGLHELVMLSNCDLSGSNSSKNSGKDMTVSGALSPPVLRQKHEPSLLLADMAWQT